MNVPQKVLEELQAAITAARHEWHHHESPERTKAFLDLAWQSGVLAYYVSEGRKQIEGESNG